VGEKKKLKDAPHFTSVGWRELKGPLSTIDLGWEAKGEGEGFGTSSVYLE